MPSIVIDLKGDLSSLACVPDVASTAAAASYLLRLHGDSASLNRASIESLAKQTERNCEGSSIGDKDVRAFRDAVEFRILTPRSDVGIPLALSPLSGLDLGSVGESGGILGNRALHELVDSNLRGLVDYLELSDVDAETLVAVLIQLLEAAHREGNTLSGIEGIVDVNSTYDPQKPELSIEIDRERAADMGVSIEKLGEAVRALIGGQEVSTFQQAGETCDIRLRLVERDRRRHVARADRAAREPPTRRRKCRHSRGPEALHGPRRHWPALRKQRSGWFSEPRATSTTARPR